MPESIADAQTPQPPSPEPLRAQLSDADDRIRLDHWMPPQQGIVPRIRIGRRWINTLWALPIGAAALLCLIALAQSLRELPSVAAFIQSHPGIAQSAPSVDSGFPWWLQLQHFLNMFFMLFIMRAGLQILADHPRLYWGRDCTPGTDWFRFQVPVPKDRIWTAKDDSVTLPTWLGIPGLRHTLGLSRWWHFSINLLWLINGIAFYVLLFSTDQWRRLVPLTWEVFPAALSTAIQYASLNFPVDEGWTRYNGLQQLSYFITVFVAAPVSIATGLMQSPAISNALGWFGRLFNRQAMRSVHFISFAWFVGFILAHGAMVFVTGIRQNTNHMFGGVNDASWTGFPLFLLAMAILVAAWLVASPFTIRHARLVQRTGAFMIGWLMGLAEGWDPRSQLTKKDISPYFWPNGTMPNSKEFDDLVAENFASYRLRISGLVETPRDFSLADLKAMAKQEQITTHFCIQGWSGVAEWGGVPDARYSRSGEADAGGALRRVLLVGRWRRWRSLLRRPQDREHAPCADDPRLRDERRAGQHPSWRALAAAMRERVGLQDGQMDRSDRVRARFRRPWRGPGRLQRGPRVLWLPDADLIADNNGDYDDA